MINLTVVIDNDEAIRKLKELQNVAKSTTSSVVKDSERMDASWQQMKNTLMSLTAGVSFAALAKQVVQIRGEVQQLEVAFETMLGSKQKADTLMTEIIDLVARTPFGLQDVSNGTKMLLAYGSAAEDVTDEIKMLGNIASGLSIPLNDLIYLYGTTRTQGRMFTMDLRQFMGRGIPLAEELAKQFGVTKDKVGELVTAGKVGFDEMNKALMAMTSEGGKFYNLMDKQSQTISGQISNLEDSIYQMFNEIGSKTEGIISGSVSVVASLVENYEQVGRILAGLVMTYGTYNAAVMLASATMKGYTIAELAHYSALVVVEKAQKLLNATILKNPYVLMATLVAGLVAVLISQKTATERLREAEEDYAAAKQDVIDKEEAHKRAMNDLISAAEDESLATDLRKEALHDLIRQYPEVFQKYETELDMLKNIKQIKLEIAEIEAGKSITNPKNELAEVEKQIAAIMAPLKKNENLSGASVAYGYTLSDDDKARLKQLQNRRDELKKQIRAENRNAALKDLSSWSDYDIEDEIDRLQRGLKMLKDNNGIATDEYILKGFKGYDEKQFEAEIQILQAEQNARKADTKSAKEWLAEKKKAYEDAQKAYDDYVKNNKGKIKAEDFEKEAQRLKEEADTAKKEYQSYAPSTDKTAKEQERRAKDIKETSLRFEREAQQAVIDAMAEGEEKKRKQIELDYQRREDELIKQEEELKKLQGGNLTDEQTAHFGNIRSSYAKGKQTALDAVDSDAKAAWNEYLSEYGTFLERKAAIAEKYNTAIANAEKEGNKALVAQLKQERIAAEAAYFDEVVTFSKAVESYSMEQITATINEMETQVIAKQAELDAMTSSDSAEYENAKKALEALKAKIEAAKKQLELLNMPSNEQEERNKKFAKFGSILSDIQNVAYSAGDALSMFNEGLGNGVRFIGQMAGGAITMIQTIQGVTSAASAAGTALSTMEKASIILTAISVGLQLIQGLLQLITFDKEGAEYERLKERYDGLISIWNELLDKKKEYIEMSYGKEANKAAEEAQDIIDKEVALNRRMAREYLDSRKNRRNLGKGYSDEGIKELQDLGLFRGNVTDADFYRNKSLTDNTDWNKILNMSAEELQNLKENASTWWAELDDEYRQYLENIIEGGEKAAEVQQMLYEQHTQMSFDDLYSSFFDAMMDMDATAEEVANNVSEYFFKAMLFNQMGENYKAKLTQWYNDFAEAMKSDGLSEEEKADLERRYKEIVEQGMQERDAIAGVTGYEGEGESQSATTKGFQAMSQETGSELNGRFTAIQGAVEFIKGISTEQLKQTTSINDTLAHIHNDTSLIEKHTRVLGQMGEDIASIKRSLDDGI